jgi:hypothetical protein
VPILHAVFITPLLPVRLHMSWTPLLVKWI